MKLQDELFQDEREFDPDFGEYGLTKSDLANAVQIWSLVRSGDDKANTVQNAADAFRVSEDLMRQVIDSHYWMFMNGDLIEHDGA
jgi:hypothetical protein